MDVVLWLVNSINESIVEMTFDSRKVLLLQRFMKSLLNILTQNENINILKKFPPQRYPQLWRILGFYHFNAHQSMLLDLLMNSLIQRTDALENIESGTEILELLEILKLIVTMNFQSVSSGKEKLLEIMQTLWGLNLEEVNTNNIFLSLFICKLCQATLTIIEHFTDEQVHCILAKMKALSCFKLELCFLLNAISTRPTKHYNAQNKLNSLISDIFEILLMERNSVVKELSVETFQQFAHNKNYIIVNNVSRMLPNLNLKQYMSGDNCDINGYFKTLEVIFCDHKCLKETPADVKTVLARTSSFLVETSPLTLQAPIKQFSNYSLSINSFDGVPQNKKIRLTEDVQEDDTISEILLRIKSEIKCLNKVLVKEPLTPKMRKSLKC
ncbi:hypothetical protein HHI36_001243 [Cryptolaemus montrouzieri]|uniref:Uncharacterized protein n=1 Tax=Cryptolaemus montrouzieri TaxID=559131 RepID=A0ABD2P7A4_9CUCU